MSGLFSARRVPGTLLLPLMLLLLVTLWLASGCDLVSSDSSDDTTDPTPEAIDTYLDNVGLQAGSATYTGGSSPYYTVSVPGHTWSEWAVPSHLYIMEAGQLYPFEPVELLLDDHDRRYVAIKANALVSTPANVTGSTFWSLADGPALASISAGSISDDVRTTITGLIHEREDGPDSLDIAIRSLGATSTGQLYWANMIQPGTIYEYDSDATPLPGYLVYGANSDNLTLTAVLLAPGGFGADKLSAADMNGDGLADLICIGLHAPGSPTRAFLYAADYAWHWVGEY